MRGLIAIGVAALLVAGCSSGSDDVPEDAAAVVERALEAMSELESYRVVHTSELRIAATDIVVPDAHRTLVVQLEPGADPASRAMTERHLERIRVDDRVFTRSCTFAEGPSNRCDALWKKLPPDPHLRHPSATPPGEDSFVYLLGRSSMDEAVNREQLGGADTLRLSGKTSLRFDTTAPETSLRYDTPIDAWIDTDTFRVVQIQIEFEEGAVVAHYSLFNEVSVEPPEDYVTIEVGTGPQELETGR